jgi:hypothetical protein
VTKKSSYGHDDWSGEPEAPDYGTSPEDDRTTGDGSDVEGTRRSPGEPLAASWDPVATTHPRRPGRGTGTSKKPMRWLRRVTSLYGWRVYAVPVLVVITALVVWDTASPGSLTPQGADQTSAEQGPPLATEVPASQANLNIPTAELPEGGQVTQAGKGSWHIVPGSGPKVGKGKLYKYTVEVEDGIDPAQYGGDQTFAKFVDTTLDDPKSWIGDGKIAVQRVDKSDPNPDFRISLTSPKTDHRPDMCSYEIKYEASCYRQSAGRVVINLARWVRGAKAFSGDMLTYRQYAINHEVGHAFGNGHVGCPKAGALAPVMMQQTFGVSNNYVAKLNKVDPLNKSAVPADGKTCKPNAWPDPEAKGTPN